MRSCLWASWANRAGTVFFLGPYTLYLTDTSIGKLLMAAVIPGLLVTCAFISLAIYKAVHSPAIAPRGLELTRDNRWSSMRKIVGMSLLIIFIFAAIYSGLTTVTEAATVGAFGAFVIGLLRRKLNMAKIGGAIGRTVSLTAIIFLLLVGVSLFSRFLNLIGFSQAIVESTIGANMSPAFMLLCIYVVFIIFGCFIDPTSLLLLVVPLMCPLVTKAGFDPIWFGVVAVMMVQMGFITPPVGMCIYVLQGVTNAPLTACFRAAKNVLIIWLIMILLLSFFPTLATWLPGKM